MKTAIKLSLTVCLLIGAIANALTPAPVSDPAQLILSNATIHIGNGQVLENQAIAMRDGDITAVGSLADMDALAERGNYRVIDLGGQHVYPGFVLPLSNLGLNEVGSLGDTVDQAETGSLNPNVRSLIAYNTDSELIPVTRFNGVLTAQVTPQGGLLSGQSSIVQLDAWNWEDAVIREDDGIHLNWPSRKRNQFDFSTFSVRLVDNKNYDKQVESLNELFTSARGYAAETAHEKRNLKLESIAGLLDGSKTLYISTTLARDVIDSVEFAGRHQIDRIVIVSDSELLKVSGFLAENEIPVIISGLHVTPNQDHEDIDLPFRVPAELAAAGVKVGLTYPGVMNARNLPFIAGTASAYGLDREQALKMITLTNAEILGIDDRLGSLEVGKVATLFVSAGDALDMRGNRLLHAFINGRQIQLDGMQQELYQRFHTRYANMKE